MNLTFYHIFLELLETGFETVRGHNTFVVDNSKKQPLKQE